MIGTPKLQTPEQGQTQVPITKYYTRVTDLTAKSIKLQAIRPIMCVSMHRAGEREREREREREKEMKANCSGSVA